MNDAPAFIVGFARSGTTLLASMLDRHSQFAVTPETHFFDQFYANAGRNITNRAVLVDALFQHPRILDLSVSPKAVLGEFEAFDCDHRGLFCATLEAYRRKRGKAHVIEKTPAHLPYVPLIFEWFPNARVVYIERDGRDAVLSLMRMPWSHRNLRRHARMWRWCVQRAAQFQQRYGDRWLTVHYETFVRQPERDLDRICAFLGAEREDAQLDATIPTKVVPEWEREWKANAASESVDAGAVQSWRSASSNDQLLAMNTMMGNALRARGYADTRMPNASGIKRVPNAALNSMYLFAYHPRIRPALTRIKRAVAPVFGGIDRDRPEVVGEDVCAEWHREHRTREQLEG